MSGESDRPSEALRAVAVALDSGTIAEDHLGAMVPKEREPNRVLRALSLGSMHDWFVARPIKPAAEQLRKASNALDVFHHDLDALARSLDDDALDAAVAESKRWGAALWDRSKTPIDVYNELRRVLALLLRHRSRLVLGRSLPDD